MAPEQTQQKDSAGTRKAKARRANGWSVYQRKDGRWEYAVTVGYLPSGNPKRVRGYAATRAEAAAEAQRISLKHQEGGFVPSSKDVKLEDFLESWLDLIVRPHREPKTVAYYEANARNHIRPAIGSVGLRKLTSQHVQRLINDKSADGLSPSTVRGIRATIRAALTHAWKEGLVAQNVASRTTPPKLRQSPPTFLSPEEVGRLLQAAQGHPLEGLFVFALWTGARIGEATGLRWVDVDLEAGEASITKQLQRIKGELRLKDLKSASSRRRLPLVGRALEALKGQRASQMIGAIEGTAPAPNPLGLVFVNGQGRPLDPKYVDEHLKATFKKANLPPMSFHKLRHTAATLMVAAGVELHQVKEQLGHSQIALTANLYAHRVPEAQRRAAGILDAVLDPRQEKEGLR